MMGHHFEGCDCASCEREVRENLRRAAVPAAPQPEPPEDRDRGVPGKPLHGLESAHVKGSLRLAAPQPETGEERESALETMLAAWPMTVEAVANCGGSCNRAPHTGEWCAECVLIRETDAIVREAYKLLRSRPVVEAPADVRAPSQDVRENGAVADAARGATDSEAHRSTLSTVEAPALSEEERRYAEQVLGELTENEAKLAFDGGERGVYYLPSKCDGAVSKALRLALSASPGAERVPDGSWREAKGAAPSTEDSVAAVRAVRGHVSAERVEQARELLERWTAVARPVTDPDVLPVIVAGDALARHIVSEIGP